MSDFIKFRWSISTPFYGLFNTGEIQGACKGKIFSVKPEIAGMGPSHHFRTTFTAECKNIGHPYFIQIKFFKDFPNWKYVSKLNPSKKVSGFFYRPVENSPYMRKSEHRLNDEEKAIIVEIFKNFNLSSAKLFETLNTKFAFETIIRIERDKIVLNKGGLILDLNRIKAVKDIVLNFSGLVEKHPIMRTPER
nr:hypothetical protein [uncultured Desulfobacter sp.]